MTSQNPPARALDLSWGLGLLALDLSAAALSLWLGTAQIQLTHGTQLGDLIAAGTPCAASLSASAAAFSGAPVLFWWLPLYAVIMLWLVGALGHGRRAVQARGGLVAITAALVVASLLLVVATNGLGCPLLIGLLAVHGGMLAAVLLPRGRRRPALPTVEDWLPALIIGLTALMASGVGARLMAFHLDQAAQAAMAEPTLDLPADAAVATALTQVGPVVIPAQRSPVPVDDQDPSVGPLDATVTAVAFLDLQDADSRRLAWTLIDLDPRFSDRVRFVTKHLPMDASCNKKRKRTRNKRACAVALALQCAAVQHAFRGYRHALLRAPAAVSDQDLRAYADALGIDRAAFASCRASQAALDAVKADIEQASKGGVIDPPWLFIEGRVIEGAADPALIEATLAVALGERSVDSDGRALASVPQVVQARDPSGPSAMVRVGDGWIDRVEDSVDVDGRAQAVLGVAPAAVSLTQARAACAASGRKLCSRSTWVAACQGAAAVDSDGVGDAFDDWPEGRLQPYGDPWRAGWCADQSFGFAGAKPGCRTPQGALDLAGNMAEWVDEGLLLGGAAGDGDAVGCGQVQEAPGPGWRTPTTGFRCCVDADAAAAADIIGPTAGTVELAAL
ncbi:MAG: thioredoxin domain-containing protein, partial [Oligoflexia bacterium]|nr:thioredoxin domain-containing protein [Oligoflexia bacterium]